MSDIWMKSGNSGPAHWIKLKGSFVLVTACNRTLSLEFAQRVRSERVGMAGAPGQFYFRPVDGAVCLECEQKAKAQA